MGCFFRQFFNISETYYLDTFAELCFSNKYYEFGPLANILKSETPRGETVIIANSTFCSGHSLIFRRHLLRRLKSILKDQNQNDFFACGELVSGYNGLAYFSSYIFALRTRPIVFLDAEISANSPIQVLRAKIPRDFRYFVYRWIRYKSFLRGWHSASKSKSRTRINYRRKLIAIYYEYKLSKTLLQDKKSVHQNLATSPVFKAFDRLHQVKIKMDHRYANKK